MTAAQVRARQEAVFEWEYRHEFQEFIKPILEQTRKRYRKEMRRQTRENILTLRLKAWWLYLTEWAPHGWKPWEMRKRFWLGVIFREDLLAPGYGSYKPANIIGPRSNRRMEHD